MNQEPTLHELLVAIQGNSTAIQENREVLDFLKDEMVSRTEFNEKLTAAKTEIITQVDGFIQLHQKLDLEFSAIQHKYSRLEEQIAKISKHLQLEWKES